jgi:hypothetical protein
MMLVAPLSAQALGVSIVGVSSSGSSNVVLQPGETITFDLVVENATAEDLFGLGLGVRGYDANANGRNDDGLSFSSGLVTDAVFNVVRNPGTPNEAFGGLPNTLSAATEFGFFNPTTDRFEELRAMLFNGVAVVGASGDGTDDVGIGGGYTGDGDIHFQVVFQATPVQRGSTDLNLDFGTIEDLGAAAIGDGGSILVFYNDSYNLTVIPEPGTALLMGLGLAGLATQRRR